MLRLLMMMGVLVLSGAVIVTAQRGRPQGAMADAAKAFLATLTPEQRAKATFGFTDAERMNWFFTPVPRKGMPLKEMSPAQQKAALELLRVGLSEQGYSKAATIRKLEEVLKVMEAGRNGPTRDPELYFFTVFGEPGADGTWGWRYEGHHCSQNWTIVNGRAIATTPQFFGSNPGEVREGPMKGTRVLAAEEDLARTLVKSLNEAQRKEAVVNATAPNDIITSNKRTVEILEDTGIAYSKLTKDQQAILISLIEEYANAQVQPIARARLQKVREAGLDSVKFAWMGSLDRGQPHYYRVQGKTFLIEYDNTQNNANHIHAVWRDFKGDFGLDLLEAHYESAPEAHGHDHVGHHAAE